MTIWAQVGIPNFQTYPDKNSRHYLWGELQNIKGHPASRRTKFALNQAPAVPELAEGCWREHLQQNPWMISLFHLIPLYPTWCPSNASNHFLQRTGVSNRFAESLGAFPLMWQHMATLYIQASEVPKLGGFAAKERTSQRRAAFCNCGPAARTPVTGH